jgi:hypothetical protein
VEVFILGGGPHADHMFLCLIWRQAKKNRTEQTACQNPHLNKERAFWNLNSPPSSRINID